MKRPQVAFLRACGVAVALATAACGAANAGTPPAMTAPAPVASTTATPSTDMAATSAPVSTSAPKPPPPIDENAVAAATGAKPESTDGVVKVSFPRTDVPVEIDGAKLAPFMGLTSWVAFTPGKPGVEAMAMGDLVLFEDEVNPVMSALLDNGLDVTALHNHFFFSKPAVYFMHVSGEGTVAALGKAVKTAMERIADIRKKAPKPSDRSGAAALPAKSAIDGAKLEAVLGVKGQAKDGMYKATMGRAATASCG